MNIFELLASPTPHGVDFAAIARSTNSNGQKTDIEWCMVGLAPFQERLMRAKWQLDQQAKHAASDCWLKRLQAFGWVDKVPSKSGVNPPPVVENLAKDTLDWWISPQKCKWCHGAVVTIDSKVVVCEACGGSGRQDRKPYSIMRALGWEDRNLRPIWVERHRVALTMLDLQESSARVHMLRRWRPVASCYEIR